MDFICADIMACARGHHTPRRKEGISSNLLVLLRTGMARLNNFLYRIGAAESNTRVCGQAAETVGHFLFRCTKWKTQWDGMLKYSQRKMGNLSFHWKIREFPSLQESDC
jgi:hypothetical protein